MWWLYLIIFVIMSIVVITCYSIRANTLRTISDNELAMRELELMTEEQRAQYFHDKKQIQNKKPPSPYGIERTMARNGKWGWSLTKNGEKINKDGTYEVWFELSQIRQLQRELERNDGCELTVF